MLLIVKMTRRNCFLSYILYLVVKRSQCCQNILVLLLWHLQSTCFFIEKIQNIKMEFPLLEACLPVYLFVDIDTIMPVCTAVFDTFQPLFCDVLVSIIHKLNRTTCGLDPFPTKLLMSHLSSFILYYQYYSTYCESLFLVWWFSSNLQVGDHIPFD